MLSITNERGERRMIEQFLLNCAMVSLCVWAVLRVPEKILDIMNKYREYREREE